MGIRRSFPGAPPCSNTDARDCWSAANPAHCWTDARSRSRSPDRVRAEKNVPWDFESGYYALTPTSSTNTAPLECQAWVQARLSEDLVRHPPRFAARTAVAPWGGASEYERLGRWGMLGMYGFYEAPTFTTRDSDGQENHCTAYMATTGHDHALAGYYLRRGHGRRFRATRVSRV